jgi:hypothetical protein
VAKLIAMAAVNLVKLKVAAMLEILFSKLAAKASAYSLIVKNVMSTAQWTELVLEGETIECKFFICFCSEYFLNKIVLLWVTF